MIRTTPLVECATFYKNLKSHLPDISPLFNLLKTITPGNYKTVVTKVTVVYSSCILVVSVASS